MRLFSAANFLEWENGRTGPPLLGRQTGRMQPLPRPVRRISGRDLVDRDDRRTYRRRGRPPAAGMAGGRVVSSPDETVLAWFPPDLDVRLHYRESLVVAHRPARLLHVERPSDGRRTAIPPGSAWPLQPKIRCSGRRDQRGARYAGARRRPGPAGALAVHARPGRGRPPVHRAVRRLPRRGRGRRRARREPCPARRVAPTPGRVRRPVRVCCRRRRPAAGLALPAAPVRPAPARCRSCSASCSPLASTAAGLIPPYLTVPLLNDVLDPAGPGLPARPVVSPRPGGGGGPGLAPELGADVRRGLGQRADRRRPAERDLRAPPEALAGILRRQADRRPDRRGCRSDTDRICNFLSINLLDFPTDVLMIVHDGGHAGGARPDAGGGDARAVPDHRLAGPPGPRPAAPRLAPRGAGPGPR